VYNFLSQGGGMALTDTTIKNAKSKEKDYTLADIRHLSLLVKSSGTKLWRYRNRVNGKAVSRGLGRYPEVSIALARKKCAELNESFAQGIDPLKQHRKEKEELSNTFEMLAKEWHLNFMKDVSERHAYVCMSRLIRHVFPKIGNISVRNISTQDILNIVKPLEFDGLSDVPKRILQDIGRIFRYGVSIGKADRDITYDLKGSLAPRKTNHHPSLTNPVKIGKMLNSIDAFPGSYIVRAALRLAPLFFVRPKELRHAEWNEFDFDNKEWRISALKMKVRIQHIVPLSDQSVKILKELMLLTGGGKYVFPGSAKNPVISDNTLNDALKKLGYGGEQTAHGFRSMASTILNEQGWNWDAIERQLSHQDPNGVRAAYNYAQYLDQRKEMMQHWADYLDKLKDGTCKTIRGC